MGATAGLILALAARSIPEALGGLVIYSCLMATEMVFSGGERVSVVGTNAVSVVGTNAETLTLTLNRVKEGPIRLVGGGQLGEGWIDVQTADGVILVNPAQVAYVRDIEEPAPVLDQAG